MASKVTYKIDLGSVFNRAYSDKSKEFRSKVRPFLSNPDVKRSVAVRAIEEIKSRTQDSNIDKNGVPLKGYSASYKKSLAFRVYGKDNSVTMTLSGEMLSSMEPVIKNRGLEVTIGFADQLNNDKAHGHIKGARYLPKRDFFGLPRELEESIVKEVVNSVASESALTDIDALISDLNIPFTVGNQDGDL